MSYQPRKIKFKEVITINNWSIKVYTITKAGEFNHPDFYSEVIKKLPSWLNDQNNFDASHEHIGFLILHAGTEGIFSLINWWVGKNMLNTHIYITPHTSANTFTKISGDGLAPCVWELEIINHERVSWTQHILKNMPHPDYKAYLNDITNITL